MQEFRSTQAAEKLKAMVNTTATVSRRDNYFEREKRKEIPIKYLVPGDIIYLSAGDMVPADVRVLGAKDLFVSQAVLTGESLPVEKHAMQDSLVEKLAIGYSRSHSSDPLEITTICFMGTNVVSGTAVAVVVATGNQTYFGSLAKKVVGKRAITSFDKGVNGVSWLLIGFMAVMVPIVFLINGITKEDWVAAFFFGISVAVGLTPEMLPMIVTANLARGAIAMSKEKAIVKRLNAIYNIGTMDVLCTDKTGTLTQNKIILERHLDIHGLPSTEALKYGYLAFLDPPKETACRAIAALEQHGVQVKVITGDNDIVTRKICKEVGLVVHHTVLGSEVELLSDEQLADIVDTTTVFAKMSLVQKARVIRILKRKGHTVGYLGDGINDAPALRDADVGISVDTAVDIAKESADIILLEKSLLVLEQGVVEGRKTFGNIIKYLKMTASSNFGNVFSVMGASVLLPFLPMMPISTLR